MICTKEGCKRQRAETGSVEKNTIEKSTMYKGMEVNREYSLEELEL